jgi:hypothetical protein
LAAHKVVRDLESETYPINLRSQIVSLFRYVLYAGLSIACLTASAVSLPSAAKQSAATQMQAQSDDDFRHDHSVVIFVSATDGNDHWSGRFAFPNHDGADGPLATLNHAREVVRSIDKSKADRVTVFFRRGTYYLPDTVTFRAADSGTASTEIVYSNFPGESPVFTGGLRVQNWTNEGENKWTTRLEASTKLFENLFYNGERRLRPRLGGYLGQIYYIANPVILKAKDLQYPRDNDSNCISIDDNNSRYECFDRFYYASNDLIANPGQNLVPQANNPCGQPSPLNQNMAGDIEILNFQQFATSKLRVNCVDTTNQIVYLTGPTTFSSANYHQDGFQQGRRYLVENVEDSLTEPGQWFLDHSGAPGTWTLTYLAKPGENPNVDDVIIPQTKPPLVRTSNLQHVMFQGLTFAYDNYVVADAGHPGRQMEIDIAPAVSIQNSQYITIDSGTFEHISGTGLEIISCLPADDGKSPPFNAPPTWCADIDTSAVTTNNVVKNSRLYDIGALGMRIGDPWVPAENDANVPQLITVENNVVEGYGRIIPSSFGIGQGMGHDNLYTHNDVYDGYHGAIAIAQLSGNNAPNPAAGNPLIGNGNNTISYNHVYDLLQGIMDDGGAIRIDAGNGAFTADGNKILNNKIHDVSDTSSFFHGASGYGGDGIYLDDSTGLVDVENNLVYRVSDTAVYTPHGPAKGGEANKVNNNILAFARQALIGVNSPYDDGEKNPNRVFNVSNNLMIFDRNANSAGHSFFVQGQCTYINQLTSYKEFQKFTNNLYWRTDGSFASETNAFYQQLMPGPDAQNPCVHDPTQPAPQGFWNFYSFAQWQGLGEDPGSVVKNPHFLFPFFPFDNFWMPFGSPVPGFVVFDPNEAGRRFHDFDPPQVPPTFMRAPFNPRTDF